ARRAERDDYIKSESVERSLGLTGDEQPVANDETELQLHMTREEVLQAARALARLDWRHGLTRDQIRRAYHHLPLGIYLRLPDSKHFTSVGEVLHEAGVASSRAEGDFMGATPDYPDEESVADGGPPGWGDEDPLYHVNAQIDGGSAEDSEGPQPGDTQGSEPGW
ncbi:MAG TPA: hypothetical protein VF510_01945, partial [Ktedonobacterales bacterium]